ncbi:MAG: hypothetical protein ACKO3H_01810 [Verrucomicrobiota bacterium]
MLSGLPGCVTASSPSSAPTPLSTSGSKPMFPTEADIRSIAGKPVGTVLRRERIATSLGNATAWKIDYVSKDSHGKLQRVGGLVVAPNSGKANRPVMTWCHGTTGIGDAGCPSALPDPARELSTYFGANSPPRSTMASRGPNGSSMPVGSSVPPTTRVWVLPGCTSTRSTGATPWMVSPSSMPSGT